MTSVANGHLLVHQRSAPGDSAVIAVAKRWRVNRPGAIESRWMCRVGSPRPIRRANGRSNRGTAGRTVLHRRAEFRQPPKQVPKLAVAARRAELLPVQAGDPPGRVARHNVSHVGTPTNQSPERRGVPKNRHGSQPVHGAGFDHSDRVDGDLRSTGGGCRQRFLCSVLSDVVLRRRPPAEKRGRRSRKRLRCTQARNPGRPLSIRRCAASWSDAAAYVNGVVRRCTVSS